MFDIGWSEILVIAVVAIVVVGPKELPKMLRTFGKTMGTLRRTANDFKRQFDEALREAERDAGLEETRKSLQSIGNPVADLKRELTAPLVPGTAAAAVATPSAPPQEPAADPHEAEPLTTASPGRERGSDAA
jgi:sec-independent protein translocase protein TatB